MAECAICKAANGDGAAFCSACGSRLAPAPAVAAPAGPVPDASLQEPSRTVEPPFLRALFDTRFVRPFTPRLARPVYVIGMVALGFMSLGTFARFSHRGGPGPIFGLIATPVIYLASLAFLRVIIEAFVALSRIAENTGALLERSGR